MPHIEIYTSAHCAYCVQAKTLLSGKGINEIQEIRIDLEPEQAAKMQQRTGRRTVPQIYINDQHIGGYDDLYALDVAGKLDPLLNKE